MRNRLCYLIPLVWLAFLQTLAAEPTRRPSVQEILQRYPDADQNGDGKLDRDEIAALRERVRKGQKSAKAPVSAAGVKATHVNVRYGPHERNLLDIWLAPSEKPTPLAVFIHGGGFVGGDKSKVYGSPEIDEFLQAGVSVATINYRFRDTDPRGVRASLADSKRAIQFLRSKSKEWNLDKERFGAWGGSAGAGTSLWLATHDDMADPDSDDPVLRESTRLSVAGCLATQATYDVTRWPSLLHFELNENMSRDGLSFFGLKSAEDLDSEEGKRIRADLDMLALMSPDDPPLYVRNNMEGGTPPKNRGHRNHHPLHAAAILQRAREVGVEAQVYAPKIGIEPAKAKQETMVQFFLRHFGIRTAKSAGKGTP